MSFRLLLPLALAQAALWAGPFIDSVSNPGGLSPGGIAEVDGGFFDAGATVQVGGKPAAVITYRQFFEGEGGERGLFIQLPVAVPPGPTSLVVTSGGLTSDPFTITLEIYSPAFVPRGVSFFGSLRLDRVLSNGGFGPWSCTPGETPRAGELARAYVYGLGATDPALEPGTPAPAMPLARTLAKPTIVVGGQSAEVVESVLAPGEIGVYRVTFKVPPGDGFQAIALKIGEKNSDPGYQPIGNAILPSFPAPRESIQTVAACGGAIVNAAGTLTADPSNPPKTLGGVTIAVKDSQGVERLAPVLLVAPDHADYIVPSDTANLGATVKIATPDSTPFFGNINVQTIAPRALMANGVPAAEIVRVRDGVQTVEPAFKPRTPTGYEPIPIDLGPETDQVFLVVFGTGFRFHQSPLSTSGIRFEDFGTNLVALAPAEYVGPQGEYVGVDQMNARLPRSLAGRTMATAFLTVDGQAMGFFAVLSFK